MNAGKGDTDPETLLKPVRTFHDQLAHGQRGEDALDRWVHQRFGTAPQPVELAQQRQGIDRQVGELTVEYKTDSQGHRTGNGFIETISVDRTGKPGWLWTTQADWVIYWLPGDGRGWLLSPLAMRERAWEWTRRFRIKVSSNPSYHSYGLLVPLSELDEVATETFTHQEG